MFDNVVGLQIVERTSKALLLLNLTHNARVSPAACIAVTDPFQPTNGLFVLFADLFEDGCLFRFNED